MQQQVLLINYYWPPCGGSAVQRWLHFVKYFDQMQIRTDVITIDPVKATFPQRDPSLLTEIPASTRVFTTDTAEAFNLYKKITGNKSVQTSTEFSGKKEGLKNKLARFVRGNFFLPDPRRGWNSYALAEAIRLIESNRYSAIITAGPPQSTHLVGLALKKRFPQLKWIADFHDYWTDNFNLNFFYRTALAQKIDRGMERKVLLAADHVLTHTDMARDLYAGRVSGIDSKLHVIRMGYDEDAVQQVSTPQSSGEGLFRLVYTGIIMELYQPEILFRALRRIMDEQPHLPLKLIFAGNIYGGLQELAKQYGLEQQLEYKGYLPHKESVQLLHAADILLLINPRNGRDKFIVPGKLFEYLAIHKPILSISSRDSENERIIAKAGAGANFDWTEEEELTQWLKEQIAARIPLQQHEVQSRYIAQFSRRAQAAAVAALL